MPRRTARLGRTAVVLPEPYQGPYPLPSTLVNLPAKLMWVMGLLVPTFVTAAIVAGVEEMWLVASVLGAIAVISIFGNWRMLRYIEEVMVRRLAIKSSEKKGLASDAKGLLGFLVPAGNVFNDDLGWAVMFVVLLVLLGIIQYVKPVPPGLILFVLGYRPHKATIAAGPIDLWLKGKDRLGPGEVVHAAEAEQKLWIGRIGDV